MTPKQRKGMAERLNLLHENTRHEGINEVGGNPRSPRNRRIPRKPSPAQIERFEALRARVMGGKLHITPAGALAHEQKQ